MSIGICTSSVYFVLNDSITLVDWQCCVPLATVTKSNLSYVIQVILYQLYVAFPHESNFWPVP